MIRGVHEVGRFNQGAGGEPFVLYWRGFGHGVEVAGGPFMAPPVSVTRIAANADDARALAKAHCNGRGEAFMERPVNTHAQRVEKCAQSVRGMAFPRGLSAVAFIAHKLRRTRKWVIRNKITM